MRLRIAALVFAGIMLANLQAAEAAGRAVVLITGKNCEMDSISTLDIRKAYHGIGVSYNKKNIAAFRLKNDTQLNQIFFQSVVAMSEKSYERRLLQMLLKNGRPRPLEFESVKVVATAIAKTPCGIAYVWKSDADALADVKVIKILWQEN
jgi:hypothetical protein